MCGAIGRFDEKRLDRLTAAAPTSVHQVHRSSTAVLFASAGLDPWTAGSDEGLFWNALAGHEAPMSWEVAAERRLAAGIRFTDRGATLHTDALGMQDLFTRRIGEALYFSIRIDPLLRLDDAKLHIDWTGWANILVVTAPLSDTTPFEEVRRVPAATAWHADDRGLHLTRFEPGWLSAEPDGAITPGDVVATIGACIPTEPSLAITLSGGWDSRLLATLARRRSDLLVAWTTSDDDGRDRDFDLAGLVAETLDIEHHRFMPGPDAWLSELSPVRRRHDFLCPLHVWLMPLARELHGRPETVLDGLGGALFKGVPEAVLATSDPAERHRLHWAALAQNRLKDPAKFAPGVAAEMEARSRASHEETVAGFDTHPAAPTLSNLHTRIARSIALSPLRIMAPEVNVSVPLVHPDVVDAALRVPLPDKSGGDFYRNMLLAADSHVARLPSTNDGGPKGRRGPRRQSSPETLAAMARTIAASDTVVRLLGPELRHALDDPDVLHRLGATVHGHRLLNWASLMAEWHTTYDDVLADDALW